MGTARVAPNRDQLWPGDAAVTALPCPGMRPVRLAEVSDKAGEYLKEFKEKMLRPKIELEHLEIQREVLGEQPYPDP